jgi:hypothetical protein
MPDEIVQESVQEDIGMVLPARNLYHLHHSIAGVSLGRVNRPNAHDPIALDGGTPNCRLADDQGADDPQRIGGLRRYHEGYGRNTGGH